MRQNAAVFQWLARSHLKRPLVFIVNGKVALAPLVNEVASSDFTWIEGLMTEADAKAWTTAINSRKATVP
jgi:hypothetical protein